MYCVRLFSSACLLAIVSAVNTVNGQSAGVTSGYVTIGDGARLFYRTAGQGPDTVIAIHGGPGVDLESIAGDFTPLEKNHMVIYYDQRGAGRSSLPTDTSTLNAAQQVLDLDAVRTHFKLQHVALVAHSYGPLLAATYAIAHPDVVSRMVFFGPVPPRRGNFWTRFAQGLNPRLDSAAQRRMVAASQALADPAMDARDACKAYWGEALKPRLADPAAVGMIKSDLCASDPRGIRYGLTITNRLVMQSYGDWDLRDALKRVTAPTLIVHGEREAIPMDLTEEWTTSLPNARLLRVPNAAHFTYAERPELVWPEVLKFLASPLPSRQE